ncbi:MAG: ribonuclease PH [Coriobacteriales bacterium]|jgi:ribonuclease PH|nr:ribonuclease PH [Coriobacteriales bacterium]
MERVSIRNQRSNGRKPDELRTVRFERGYLSSALGSCLVEFGNTRVLCAASIEENVANWLKGKNRGWVTAEYSMLPASTPVRTRRETQGPRGRTQEIQRLIGRSLRAVVDMSVLGETTMTVDCDVLQADGGTRTAAVCGAWIAMRDAFEYWKKAGRIRSNPVFDQLAAVSVGVVDGVCLLDLDYHEDSRAEVDMNLVMTGSGEFIEVQGTGERTSFDREQLDWLLDLGSSGVNALLELQRQALKPDGSTH